MHPFVTFSWRRGMRGLIAALLLGTGTLGWAQADPPSRVAYVSALEGTAEISQAPDRTQWAPATLNWPITTGTQLQVDSGSRVELDSGWLVLRLQGAADLDTTVLDDSTTQVALTSGSLSLRLRELEAGERVEIDTPQLAVVAQQPGEYRVDVDPDAGTTRVTVRAGAALLYGEAGQAMPLAGGSQVLVSGRSLGLLAQGAAPGRDAFEQWVALRDAQEDRSLSASYLPRDMPGYQELDAHGQWARDATWGPVWYPSIIIVDWAPYRYGRWIWIDPWGWTWVDDAPWGFAPFHYGRWIQIGMRWAWVPGPLVRRPVYAPALVQFFASGSGWSVSIGSSPLGVAWFPLAPGEAWQPHYHASPRYLRRINDWSRWRATARPHGDGYFFQHRPGAISVAPHGSFDRPPAPGARPHFRDGRDLPADWLRASRVTPPPARAPVPGAAPAGRPQPRTRPDGRPVPAERPFVPEGSERGLSRQEPPPRTRDASRPAPPVTPPTQAAPGQARPDGRRQVPEQRQPRPQWERDRDRRDDATQERRLMSPGAQPTETPQPRAPSRRLERESPGFDPGERGAAPTPGRPTRPQEELGSAPRTPTAGRSAERAQAAWRQEAPFAGRARAPQPRQQANEEHRPGRSEGHRQQREEPAGGRHGRPEFSSQ
ncbi:MAG TPA: hypothetical protein PKA16_03440 [Ottowia sp.]|uniref:DUF6600 domain-containing protein n=1 Tax=Ottowia sp. TaxID=1898956 RepID=UPI002C46CECF|nr:DUF6600 domain-containing protein [Ottowia sp.]HMN20427.1 hypothetical protein [Ottowia sp.]